MKDYLLNYSEIMNCWIKFQHDLEKELCEELSYNVVQIKVWLKSDLHPSAINNINFRFIELVPHAFVEERDTTISNWYEDSEKLSKVQIVVNNVSKKYDFQFVGIETHENIPVIIVKLGEIWQSP